jgi:hypothetical protein
MVLKPQPSCCDVTDRALVVRTAPETMSLVLTAAAPAAAETMRPDTITRALKRLMRKSMDQGHP